MNSPCKALAATSLLFLASLANAAPTTYTIATKISRVTFSLEHQGFIQLFGSLRIAPGTISFDCDAWSKSSVHVVMPTRSLDMGDALWNRQIRGDKSWAALFANSSIEFQSTELKQSSSGRGTLLGTLTVAGVTKPVSLALIVNKIARNAITQRPSVGFSATTTIKRSDFALGAYSKLVGDQINIQIQLEAFTGADTEDQSDLSAKGIAQGNL